jgi:hypothetical protein
MAGATLPSYPSFDPDNDLSSLPQKWEEWLDGLETLISAMAITDHERKWSILKYYGGEKIRKLKKQLTYDKTTVYGADPAADPPIRGEADHFRHLKEAFTAHFAPIFNRKHARFRFHSICQEEDESIDAFVSRLRDQASRCGFHDGDCANESIRDRIVLGCRSQKIRLKAMAEDLSLDRLLQVARSEESARANVEEIETAGDLQTLNNTAEVFKVSKRPGKYSNRPGNSVSTSVPVASAAPATNYADQASNPPRQSLKCFNCGGLFPHQSGKPCPAKGRACSKCQKINHFASVCRGGRPMYAASIRSNFDHDSADVVHLGKVRIIGSIDEEPMSVMIKSKEGGIVFNPDTGADVTLIDRSIYNNLNPRPNLQISIVRLLPYGASKPLQLLGSYDTRLNVGERSVEERIFVSKNRNRGISLLSRGASRGLGLVTVNIPSTQVHQIESMPLEGTNTHHLLAKFLDISKGVGCHRDLKLSLPLKAGAVPSVAPPSRIPVNLFSKVKAELDRLTDEGVFEDVSVDDNTQFVSRLVPVPKRVEGSDEMGLRITMDWRELNKNLDPVHHLVPTVEQLKHDLNGAKRFSQIDLKDAFYQLPLDDESKRLTTFATPWGLKRSTRLIQGATPSSSICHEVLRRDLQGIHRALNIADNILVWACGETEDEIQRDHDRTLLEVFQMFQRIGPTLNPAKCIFNASRTKFFGYVFSAEGIQPDPDKVAALKGADAPKSKEEVCSFLGMAGFNAQFIPQYATMSEPLRNLTRKDVNFTWGPEEREVFMAISNAISESTMLSYFDIRKETALFTDASPVGVNATLAQLNEKGFFQPVNIASRALTEAETRYDQLEREAVAMLFGCTRFKIFLEGTHFTHFIDPEPLKHMMEKSKKDAPARIEKVRLKLQGFNFTIKVIKGKYNPADYLSRHPLPYATCSKAERESYNDIQNHLFVITQMLPEAITVERVMEATARDPVLTSIISALRAGKRAPDHSNKQFAPFRPIWSELSVAAGMLFRSERIVIPQGLVRDTLRLAHEGHMGIQNSKRYLRSCVWFPRMDAMVETVVRNCIPCQEVTPTPTKTPLTMTPLPPEPWQLVAADIFGPLPGGEKILVLKCLRSKWPEVKVFLRNQSTNAAGVISAMEKMFSTHGIPDTIRTDNGPPFNSKVFKEFSKRIGFQTQKVTPLWPQANGQAEAFMKCLGKIIRVAHIENRDWKCALNEFMMVYRATPHPSTGATPASLMYPGRRFKTHLPPSPIHSSSNASVERHHERAMKAAKFYADRRRNAKDCDLMIGDTVLVRQRKRNKLSSYYDPNPYVVTDAKGTMITAVRGKHKIVRNSSFFKRVPALPQPTSRNRGRVQKTAPDGVPGTLFLPEPPLAEGAGAADSDYEEFLDPVGGEPVNIDEAEAAPPTQPIEIFHPSRDLPVVSRPFLLPPDIRNVPGQRAPPYNLRSSSGETD